MSEKYLIIGDYPEEEQRYGYQDRDDAILLDTAETVAEAREKAQALLKEGYEVLNIYRAEVVGMEGKKDHRHYCPHCSSGMQYYISREGDQDRWVCPNCNAVFPVL